MEQPGADQFSEWAEWFRALSDPTRLRILNHVSGLEEPAPVGAIVAALDLTQSNVSHHLRILAEHRFVFLHPDGTRTLVEANRLCMSELPDAAAAIMQRGE